MRRDILMIILILLCCVGYVGCQPEKKQDLSGSSHKYSLPKAQENDAKIVNVKFMDSVSFGFGKIKLGDTIVHAFRFRNIGQKPLIITDASASCGCTVASYNKLPIPPGMVDSVVAVFISKKGTLGFQNKRITVKYSTSFSPLILTLYGFVK